MHSFLQSFPELYANASMCPYCFLHGASGNHTSVSLPMTRQLHVQLVPREKGEPVPTKGQEGYWVLTIAHTGKQPKWRRDT